ncbi:MAG: hypothetical protein JWM31_326, partial [Solirubrobacterales bacterium]|nr:hypothetical protein [Solirubrobacterales bacterium]
RVRAGRRANVRIRVRRVGGGGHLVPVAGALVRLAGGRARTDAHGLATVRKRFVARGTRIVLATRAGYLVGTGRVVVTR